ncbi:MAG TPA: T9SS type A sorting domain-containing protein, partial [Candidatus Kapabacteria bacterium]|nr:T9SS type A sorting domain-containing protein [Candidatus Kapabacteria bacterium]
RKEQHDTTFKDRPIVKRVNLYNIGSSTTRIDKVIFRGPDSAEYSITGNQYNQVPLEGFIMNVGDTIWVDYKFTPNISKPEAVRYLDRHADLIAVFFSDAAHTKRDTTVIHMTGVVDSLTNEVSSAPTSSEITLHPYIANDKLIIPTPGIDNIKEISLYDLLGKKVMQWSGKEIELAQMELLLPKPNISSGLYILKIEADRMSASGKVQILKE